MKKLFFIFVLVLLSTSIYAKERGKLAKAFRNCGLGAMIFDEEPIGAIISNIVWDLGTTATTSSSMSPDSCAGSERSQY
jgi:hypothetical protein